MRLIIIIKILILIIIIITILILIITIIIINIVVIETVFEKSSLVFEWLSKALQDKTNR